MEHGKLPRSRFMQEIVGLTQSIVEKAKTFDESGLKARPLGFNAPNGKPMVETLRNYETEDGSVKLRKVVAGRVLEPAEAKELLEKKFIGPLQGFRSKAGWPFAAALKLNAAGEIEFVFDNAPVNADGSALDLNTAQQLGTCPVCGGRVFETMMAYACENTFGDEPKCKMKIGKVILQQPIDPAQVDKLLTQKKTDLLRGFISQRTKRKFSAFLVMGPDGKTTFEFEPRPEGGKGKKPFGKKSFGKKSADDAASPAEPAATGETNGHAGKIDPKSVMPKNVIRRGSRKKK
jgi:DNA topoisomerase-3